MSSNTNVLMMDQTADVQATSAGNVVQSPLAHIGSISIKETLQERITLSTVTLKESPVEGLLIVRAASAQENLSRSLQKIVSLTLPDRLMSAQVDDYCIRWMSPDEWLLSCPLQEAFTIESRIREACDGHIAVVNVSGGLSVLELSGQGARNVLKKSTTYDVDPVNFRVGKVVNTTFAKTQVTLRALPDEAYELIVRRSYADYVWLWLQRAGQEYAMKAMAAET